MENSEILALVECGHLVVDVDKGLVYSTLANNPTKPLGSKTKKGYLRTCINQNGRTTGVMVHRIVCLVAHGMPPTEQHLVNHKNTHKTDNRGDNLEWMTNAENSQHAGDNGLLGNASGEDHYRAKIKAADVDDIRRIYATNIAGRQRVKRGTLQQLSAKYGICPDQVRRVAQGQSWGGPAE